MSIWRFMPRPVLIVLIALLLTPLLSACERAEEDPTPTPDQESIEAMGQLFAQPTRESRVTPSPTPVNEVELELNRVVARMERAVLAGDVETYMQYVWPEEESFYADHLAWARDWQEHPLSEFDLELFGIQATDPDVARARMTLTWSQLERGTSNSSGGATASVVFYRNPETEQWQLGGEDWAKAEFPGIVFYYFDKELVDNRDQAQVVEQFLPSLQVLLVREFDFEPEVDAHLKMYENAVTLHNWTRLSMPLLTEWNAPGESIKITLGPSDTPPLETEIAAEYTRFLLFEMAGRSREPYPWWVETGVSEFGGLSFATFSVRNRVIKRVATLSGVQGSGEEGLLDWRQLATEPGLPSLRQSGAEQAFTLVFYITETYGEDERNAWLKGIAGGQSVEEATEAHLGLSFDELDNDWRAWLVTQL